MRRSTLLWQRDDDKIFPCSYSLTTFVYDAPLTGGQVAELARVVRYAGTMDEESALAMPVLPTNSPVTVAAGAVLETKGRANYALASLAGAGTVKVNGGTTFTVESLDGFSGTFTGAGRLLLAEGQTLALPAAHDQSPEFDHKEFSE